MNPAKPKKGEVEAAPSPLLSPRQRQILKLLQAGKVNKEVAEELDIGLGTVKQHIVALFKKLNVSNRAMAVSRGLSLQQERQSGRSALMADGLLERRPCVVLCSVLPEDASPMALRLMHGALAELAAVGNALYLARKGNAGEIIFGIQQASVYDLALALQTLRLVYDDIERLDSHTAANLRGCLAAGTAVVSMKRFGGWTGEAIASTAIAAARALLAQTPAGHCSLNQDALELLRVFGIAGEQAVTPCLPLPALDDLRWSGSRQTFPLVGRNAELATLRSGIKQAEEGQGNLFVVKGEMGMGKSCLCQEALAICHQKGDGRLFRCLPPMLGSPLYDASAGANCAWNEALTALCAPPRCRPELIVVDDWHLLANDQQLELTSAATQAVRQGKMVILSGRRELTASEDVQTTTILLTRLPLEAVAMLVRKSMAQIGLKRQAGVVEAIANAAAGVPLFAIELARAPEAESLTLPLQLVINGRLDSLHLDRILLRAIAKSPGPPSLKGIAALLGEDIDSVRRQVDTAVAAGVLTKGGEGTITFSHPLLRRAIISLTMEYYETETSDHL